MGPIRDAAMFIGPALKAVGGLAKAHPFITGASIGAVDAGARAINTIRDNRAQAQQAEFAKQQAGQVMALQAQQAQQSMRQNELAAQAIEEATRRRQDMFKSLTKPVSTADTTPLRGLGTIATSPLGDPSEPNLGKRKLLGN